MRCLVNQRTFRHIRHTSTAPDRFLASSSSTINTALPTTESPSSSTSRSSTATHTSSASSSTAATHHLVTLTRSSLNLPSYSSRTLVSLGLKRRYQSVLHPFSPTVAGHILRVKEIVSVKNVSLEEGNRWMAMTRREGSGVVVSGRSYGGGGIQTEGMGGRP